jgi:hypothetical protein
MFSRFGKAVFNILLVSILTASFLVLFGCSKYTVKEPDTENIDKVLIIKDGNHCIIQIDDKEKIKRIIEFIEIQKVKKDWYKPSFGFPVPTYTIVLYDGNVRRGHFGVGENFFEVYNTYYREYTLEEVERIYELIEVDETSSHEATANCRQ